MTRHRMLGMSERWFRLLHQMYPPDFRDDMGDAAIEAYMDRAGEALRTGGSIRLVALWIRALVDALRNGPAEWVRPAASWRRAGNWGRDLEFVARRLVRSPIFAATTIGTLTVGLGMFAVVYTAVQRILIDPMPTKALAISITSGATTDRLPISNAGHWAELTSRSCRERTRSSRTPRACSSSSAGSSLCGKAPSRWKSP